MLSEFKADIVTMFRFCHRVHNTRYRIRGHTSMRADRWWHRFAVILRTALKRDRTQHVAVLPSYYLRFSFHFLLLNYVFLCNLRLLLNYIYYMLHLLYVTQKLLDVSTLSSAGFREAYELFE